jgi:SAM-dependent methyltransferase
VACGLGRNAVHLARLGFAVDALDVSPVAVARLSEHAREHALPIAARVRDLRADPRLPHSRYDVVVCTFFLERSLFAPMAAALAPGGLLVVEAFTRVQAGRARGPSDPRMLLEAGELAGAFPGLELLDAREHDDGELAVSGVVVRRAP